MGTIEFLNGLFGGGIVVGITGLILALIKLLSHLRGKKKEKVEVKSVEIDNEDKVIDRWIAYGDKRDEEIVKKDTRNEYLETENIRKEGVIVRLLEENGNLKAENVRLKTRECIVMCADRDPESDLYKFIKPKK